MGIMEFSHLNLRKDKEHKRQLKSWISAKIGLLPELYFSADERHAWKVDDAYLKIIGWRNYKKYKAPEPTNNMSTLNLEPLNEESTVDALRKRCYVLDEEISSPKDVQESFRDDDYVPCMENLACETSQVLQENGQRQSNEMNSYAQFLQGNHDILEKMIYKDSYHAESSIQNNIPSYKKATCNFANEGVSMPQGHPIECALSTYKGVSMPQGHPIECALSTYKVVNLDEEEDDEVALLGTGSLLQLITNGADMSTKVDFSIDDDQILQLTNAQKLIKSNVDTEPNTSSLDVTPLLDNCEDAPLESSKKILKFSSLNGIMDKENTTLGQVVMHKQDMKKKKTIKRKVLKDVANQEVYPPISTNKDAFKGVLSRSSRIVKRSQRFVENNDGKEIALTNLDVDEMEAIAVEAMEICDIDEMYRKLWFHLKEIKEMSALKTSTRPSYMRYLRTSPHSVKGEEYKDWSTLLEDVVIMLIVDLMQF
ncbi:hypothetical protein L7F22_012039 [Adiantum nelumboides]|nr:hypothetical protein [Adiantum nelumboides]